MLDADDSVRDDMRRCGCTRCQVTEPLPVYGTTLGVSAHRPCMLPELFDSMSACRKAACYRMGLWRRR